MRKKYKSFESFINNIPKNKKPLEGLDICIATLDFRGFVRNGGIGTSFYHTACILRDAGAKITIFYASNLGHISNTSIQDISANLESEGFSIILLSNSFNILKIHHKFLPNDEFTITSYLTYQALKNYQYDLILFHEWRGLPYFSLLAKKQGIAFQNTCMWVQTHSSTLWHSLHNQQESFNEIDLRGYEMERKSVELADLVLSPTYYLLDWMKEYGFHLPEETYRQPYPIIYKDASNRNQIVSNVSELVFFGRLEKRKGLHYFVNAAKRLSAIYPDIFNKSITLSFIGKHTIIEGRSALEYIKDTLGNTKFNILVLPSFNAEESIEYLKKKHAAAFICSIADNSPLTVLECLYNNIPFIATNVGGIPELFPEEDHKNNLVGLDVRDITDKMYHTLKHGIKTSAPNINQQLDNIPAYIGGILHFVKKNERTIVKKTISPQVGIAITHFNRPDYLRKTLEGLQNQTYQNFKVIVVDDGSTDKDALTYLKQLENKVLDFPFSIIRQNNEFVGAARNRALHELDTEYIVFMDDDNYAHPKQIETFVKAITNSNYDALSCCCISFQQDQNPANLEDFLHIYIPIGSGLSLNLLNNSYGDANGIFRRKSLLNVGGFSEDYGLSWEDYELYFKLETAGYKVGTIPEPLVYLRSTYNSLSRSNSMIPNHYRAIRPLLSKLPWGTFGDAILICISSGLSKSNFTFNESKTSLDTNLKLVNNSDSPDVFARKCSKYLIDNGNITEALSLLECTAENSYTLGFLYLDWAILNIENENTNNTIRKLKVKQGLEAKIIAEFIAVIYKAEENTLLIKYLKELLNLRGFLAPDLSMILGRCYLFDNNIVQSIKSFSELYNEIDNYYVDNQPAISKAINSGYFRNGIHYLLDRGIKETDRIIYEKPMKDLAAINETSSNIDNYNVRIDKMLKGKFVNDWQLCNELLVESLNNNTPLERSEISYFVYNTAEARYLQENPDIQRAKNSKLINSGLDHYCNYGIKEGRNCPLDNLNINLLKSTFQVKQDISNHDLNNILNSISKI